MIWSLLALGSAVWVVYEFRHSPARGSGWIVVFLLALYVCLMTSSFINEREVMWSRWQGHWEQEWAAERITLEQARGEYHRWQGVVQEYERHMERLHGRRR